MKHFLLLLSALFFAAADAQPLEKSLLWKISGNGLAQPSYLYGTIHASCEVKLGKNVQTAMDQTQQLYLEMDMDDPGMQAAMMQGINMKGGKKMSDLASKDDYAAVDSFLQKNLGIPLTVMNTVKPVFISTLLVTKLLDCTIQSVESELMAISAAQKEEVFGLETLAEQMAVMDAMPYEEQMKELVKTAKNGMETDKKEFAHLLELYQAQDIEGMITASQQSENAMTAKFEKELLTDRNQNWIAKIESICKQKPTFFGVGAAHLAGENGVIKLLRKKGYKVEAVK